MIAIQPGESLTRVPATAPPIEGGTHMFYLYPNCSPTQSTIHPEETRVTSTSHLPATAPLIEGAARQKVLGAGENRLRALGRDTAAHVDHE